MSARVPVTGRIGIEHGAGMPGCWYPGDPPYLAQAQARGDLAVRGRGRFPWVAEQLRCVRPVIHN
jgi:hypothetical protein